MSGTTETKGSGGVARDSATGKYMGGQYVYINSYLRTGKPPSQNSVDLANTMKGELPHFPRVPSGRTLYRHVGGREILKDDNKEYGNKRREPFRTGGVFRDKGFMSTSKTEENITEAVKNSLKTQHVLVITTCADSAARDVSALRANVDEAEAIYPPEVKFKVISKSNRKFGSQTARVWNLQEQTEGLHKGSASMATMAD